MTREDVQWTMDDLRIRERWDRGSSCKATSDERGRSSRGFGEDIEDGLRGEAGERLTEGVRVCVCALGLERAVAELGEVRCGEMRNEARRCRRARRWSVHKESTSTVLVLLGDCPSSIVQGGEVDWQENPRKPGGD